LRAGLASLVTSPWLPSHANETFVAVAVTKDPAQSAEYWLADLKAGTVTIATREAQENSDWDVIGSMETWEQVIDGRLNYYVALRSCQLRYCDSGDASPLVSETRAGILAHLLGLKTW
jgi:hypothetical protein